MLKLIKCMNNNNKINNMIKLVNKIRHFYNK